MYECEICGDACEKLLVLEEQRTDDTVPVFGGATPGEKSPPKACSVRCFMAWGARWIETDQTNKVDAQWRSMHPTPLKKSRQYQLMEEALAELGGWEEKNAELELEDALAVKMEKAETIAEELGSDDAEVTMRIVRMRTPVINALLGLRHDRDTLRQRYEQEVRALPEHNPFERPDGHAFQ